MAEKDTRELSVQGVKRLPYYLKYLKELEASNTPYVPAAAIADSLGIYEVQVRKDLAAVSSQPGKPRVGFCVHWLIEDIQHFLGYDNANVAVLVGAGHLGQALLSYGEFAHYGLKIAAAFDNNPDLQGSSIHGCPVYGMDMLPIVCQQNSIPIGIITTPAQYAQDVCDQLVAAGCKAIWNFAPTHLDVPDNILVQNENMATSLAVLSVHLQAQIKEAGESILSFRKVRIRQDMLGHRSFGAITRCPSAAFTLS